MSSLSSFSKPKDGQMAQSGKNQQVSSIPVNLIDSRTINLAGYPKINIRRDLHTQPHQDVPVLLRVNQSIYKQFISTYVDEGFEAALTELKEQNVNPAFATFAWGILRLLEVKQKIVTFCHPNAAKVTDYTFSGTRNWPRSHIRSIAWHPNCAKLALATKDDAIYLYHKQGNESNTLKHEKQRGILCMAWRPWCHGQLAVGGQNGLVLWNVDQMLSSLALKSQSATLDANLPVTSLCWNPSGTYLATVSTSSPQVLLFDVDRNKPVKLRLIRLPCALISWSPNEAIVCSSTVSGLFRIWNTTNWLHVNRDEKYGVMQSIAWSACSRFMLFVTTDSPMLWCLAFAEQEIFEKQPDQKRNANMIADFSKVKLEEQEVGGLPNSIALNPRGTLLAVSFKTTDLVAVFSVSTSKFVINVTPFGLINGLGAEYPTIIQFENTKERDVLTICWSSGRVQFFPFV